MNYAYKKMYPTLPFNSEKISSLSDDEIVHIDQFIFRFSKLQDAIGNKLFKAVLASLDEEVINKPALDIFNKLEQLEVISNYENWKELRDLRNELRMIMRKTQPRLLRNSIYYLIKNNYWKNTLTIL
jgi:hypothetical protein